MRSPDKISVKEWNEMTSEEKNKHWKLPKGVRWTKEFPTEDGWYFIKFIEGNIIKYGTICEITKTNLIFWESLFNKITFKKSDNSLEYCQIKSINGGSI